MPLSGLCWPSVGVSPVWSMFGSGENPFPLKREYGLFPVKLHFFRSKKFSLFFCFVFIV